MLRKIDWIHDEGIQVGGTTDLNLKEMGVVGLAEVVAINPCPPLEEGDCNLITGTFRHTNAKVLDLSVESEEKPIGVTPTHPLWSMDRHRWVPASELREGERLKTLDGTTDVESLTPRPGLHTVYNIEVDTDHVYRVGQSGLLVHNESLPNTIPVGDEPCERRLDTMTCTNERLAELEAEKDVLQAAVPGMSCSKSKISRKRLAKYLCSEIRARIDALRLLKAKRQQIQDECFGATPDQAHADAIEDVEKGIKACEVLEKVNCAPGHPMAGL